ncbi:MAG: hypothetical protein SGCHY_005057, partial [Lobulomycetales sp.]
MKSKHNVAVTQLKLLMLLCLSRARANTDCQVLNDWVPSLFNREDCCLQSGITCTQARIAEIEISAPSNRIGGPIPESIGNLTSLTRLILAVNQITAIPESIGNLASLTDVDLSFNQITAIPESIGNLSSLTVLHMNNNQITTIPASLGNLA